MKKTITPKEGRNWPGYILWGRVRTSTVALIMVFIGCWWLYETYDTGPDPSQVPASNVVPPGFIPDPAYTWVPRTDVQRPDLSITTTETTPTTSTTPTTPTSPGADGTTTDTPTSGAPTSGVPTSGAPTSGATSGVPPSPTASSTAPVPTGATSAGPTSTSAATAAPTPLTPSTTAPGAAPARQGAP